MALRVTEGLPAKYKCDRDLIDATAHLLNFQDYLTEHKIDPPTENNPDRRIELFKLALTGKRQKMVSRHFLIVANQTREL